MTSPARRWTGDAMMLMTALLMGSSYPVAKDVLAVMSPLLYSGSRYVIAGLFKIGDCTAPPVRMLVFQKHCTVIVRERIPRI